MDIGADVLRFGGGFLPAFVLTWLIESIVYLLAFRSLDWIGRSGPPGHPRLTAARTLVLVLLVNLATHPLLWWFTSVEPGLAPLLAAEAMAVLIEGTIIAVVAGRRTGAARFWVWAYLAALLANAVSLLVGLALLRPALTALGVAGSSVCC